MTLDIRLPIGLMFTLIGFLLATSGFLNRADVESYRCSLGININLVWGLVLLVFGVLMLIASWLDAQAEEKNRTSTRKETTAPRRLRA